MGENQSKGEKAYSFDFSNKNKLGEGSFSSVYKIKHKETK